MVDGDGGREAVFGRSVRRSDAVLRPLLAAERKGLGGKRLERIRAAEVDLRRCIGAHALRFLTEPERALVGLEQEFDPIGAAERVASTEVVLLVLPAFLRDPRWAGEDLEDRRLRIRLVGAFAEAARMQPELADDAWQRAMRDVSSAVAEARLELRRARGAEHVGS